jgi:hypothetical protein
VTSYMDRPASDLSDDELRIATAMAGKLRDEAAARGQHEVASRYQSWALVLADHRDRRARLRRDVEDAVNPFQVVGKVECETNVETDDVAGRNDTEFGT